MGEYDYIDTERDRRRLAEKRIDVIQLHNMEASLGSVEAVAEKWDVREEAVREAVEYYHDHEDELERVRREDAADVEVAREMQSGGEL